MFSCAWPEWPGWQHPQNLTELHRSVLSEQGLCRSNLLAKRTADDAVESRRARKPTCPQCMRPPAITHAPFNPLLTDEFVFLCTDSITPAGAEDDARMGGAADEPASSTVSAFGAVSPAPSLQLMGGLASTGDGVLPVTPRPAHCAGALPAPLHLTCTWLQSCT